MLVTSQSAGAVLIAAEALHADGSCETIDLQEGSCLLSPREPKQILAVSILADAQINTIRIGEQAALWVPDIAAPAFAEDVGDRCLDVQAEA